MNHRVIAYIDGFNLYHGLREKKWKWAYWLNIQELMRCFLKPNQRLVSTKYFTSIVNKPLDKHDRQAAFLDALRTLSDFSIFYGHFLSDPVECYGCGRVRTVYHEKMTDVNIATEMIMDAFTDRYDVALLVTADSDLVAPINAIHHQFPAKKIVTVFPPERASKQLKQVANGYTYISDDKLSKCLFPDEVVKPDGYVLHRPKKWR